MEPIKRESHPELVPEQPSQADQIRQYVISELIEPARFARRGHVIIRSGDVHRALGLHNRMPAVCGAMDAAFFEEQAQVEVISRTGPHQSSTVEWVLRLN